MNLEEFNYQFGVDGAENLMRKLNQIETETEELDQAVDHLGNTFQKFFDAALRSTIPPAFIKMVMDQAMAFSKQAEYVDRLAQVAGTSARNIQLLGYALHRFGGDVDTAASQFDHLQSKLDKFQRPIHKGGGLASELATLSKKHKVNLNGVTSTFDLLKAIAERMEKLSERKKVDLKKAFGLDDSTFLLVKKGLKGVEEALYRAQKYVLFDDREIQQAKDFEDTLRDIADNITLISKSFSFGAIPEMQKFANIMRTVTDFMTEHKEVVKGIGMTAFGTGLYGVFRLLNLMPTKFLAGAAGVFGTGFGIGAINEEVDKLNRGKRDLTLTGFFEEHQWKKTAEYTEAIFRAINDLTQNKSFAGFGNLFDKIKNDLGVSFKSSTEKFSKAVEDFNTASSEYMDVFNQHGIKGVLALKMTPKEGTIEERLKKYKENIKRIDKEGGVMGFLWKEAKETYETIKKTLGSKEFWTPIFDKINSVFDYLKGLFYDLVIFVKQQFGMELSTSEKAHLIKKELNNKERNLANKDIQEAAKQITETMLNGSSFEEKKQQLDKQVWQLSSQIHKDYGNSGYSQEGIAARLLYEGTKGAFQKKNPTIAKGAKDIFDTIKGFGLDFLVTFDQVTKFYEEYKNKASSKIEGAKSNLNKTVDISGIAGNVKVDGVDLKKVSLKTFIDKVSSLLSAEQITSVINKFKDVFSEDQLTNALSYLETKKESFSGVMSKFFEPYKKDFNLIMKKFSSKEKDKEETKEEAVQEPETFLGKWVDKIATAFVDFFKKITDNFLELIKPITDPIKNFYNSNISPAFSDAKLSLLPLIKWRFGQIIHDDEERANNPLYKKILRIEKANARQNVGGYFKPLDPKNLDILQESIDAEENLSWKELIVEYIKAEYEDLRRNYISIDKAIEKIGKIFEEISSILGSVLESIKAFKMNELMANFLATLSATVGAFIGSFFGPAGTVIGGALGYAFGYSRGNNMFVTETRRKEIIEENKKYDQIINNSKSKKLDVAKAKLKKLLNRQALGEDIDILSSVYDLIPKFDDPAVKTTDELFRRKGVTPPENLSNFERAKLLRKLYSNDKKYSEMSSKEKEEFWEGIRYDFPMFADEANQNIEQLQMLQGHKNLRTMGKSVANSNQAIINDNRNTTINQYIELQDDGRSTEENLKKAGKEGTTEALRSENLRFATISTAGGNII